MTCNEKWSLNNWQWPAQWLDREEALKHFWKPNWYQKKVMVTVWLSAAHLIHYCFLNPGETIIADKDVQQIDEMHRKLQCMQPAGQHKGPNSSPRQHLTTCGTTKASKGEWIRLQQVLPQLPYSPKLLPTDYHFFKNLHNFLQGKTFHNEQETKNAFQEFVRSWSIDFYTTGINLFLIGKSVDCNGSCFD